MALEEVTDAERAELTQYRPTEEELRELERSRKGKVRKISEVMEAAAKEAERRFGEAETAGASNAGEFVNSCYVSEGVDLLLLEETINAMKIANSDRLVEIYGFGDHVNLEGLMRGDLVFLNRDRFVGVYVGEGDFITYTKEEDNPEQGILVKGNLEEDIWSEFFEGHVRRLYR